MRRLIAIAAWVLAACLTWLAASIGGVSAVKVLDPRLLDAVLKAVAPLVFLSGILVVGPLVVTIVVAFLGLAGKLPGTRHQPPGRPPPFAFPVVPLRRHGDEG